MDNLQSNRKETFSESHRILNSQEDFDRFSDLIAVDGPMPSQSKNIQVVQDTSTVPPYNQYPELRNDLKFVPMLSPDEQGMVKEQIKNLQKFVIPKLEDLPDPRDVKIWEEKIV
jgi:hypothetical protein